MLEHTRPYFRPIHRGHTDWLKMALREYVGLHEAKTGKISDVTSYRQNLYPCTPGSACLRHSQETGLSRLAKLVTSL